MYSLPGSLAVVVASIVRLLFARRPTAISRLVVAVVVDTLDRMLRRGARPHVSEEFRKILSPTVGHGDPSATVAMVIRVMLFVATTLGVEPRLILGGAGAPVSARIEGPLLSIEATAALRATLPKGLPVHGFLCSAFTAALPVCSSARIYVGEGDDHPAANFSAFKLKSWSHKAQYTVCLAGEQHPRFG